MHGEPLGATAEMSNVRKHIEGVRFPSLFSLSFSRLTTSLSVNGAEFARFESGCPDPEGGDGGESVKTESKVKRTNSSSKH